MTNQLSSPIGQDEAPKLAKPRFFDYLTRREKWRMAVMGGALAAGTWGAAHMAGLDQFVDPIYPVASNAELNEANYPDRTAMQQVLLERIRVTASCTITTRSYGTVSVYADSARPFDLPEGVDERQVQNDDQVLPHCAQLIRDEFSNGRGLYVRYEINIRNAWSGSVNAPGFGTFEREDENGNGILHEPMRLTLGNKWHDNDAIDRLDDAQNDFNNIRTRLSERSSHGANALNRAWQWTKDTAWSLIGFDTLGDQIQTRLWNSVTGKETTHEVRPS